MKFKCDRILSGGKNDRFRNNSVAANAVENSAAAERISSKNNRKSESEYRNTHRENCRP